MRCTVHSPPGFAGGTQTYLMESPTSTDLGAGRTHDRGAPTGNLEITDARGAPAPVPLL